MKFSSLPANIQAEVKAEWMAGKVVSANERSRYYAQNGYATPAEYHQVVLAEAPTADELKIIIIEVMKARFIKNGFEDWMNQIPNAAMICRNYNELVMMTKAGK